MGFFPDIKKSMFFGDYFSQLFVSQGFSATLLSGWKLFISGAWNSRGVLKTFMKTFYMLFPFSHWYKLLQSWFERSRLNLFASNFFLFLLIKLCFLFLGSTRKLVVYKTIKWSISTDGKQIWTWKLTNRTIATKSTFSLLGKQNQNAVCFFFKRLSFALSAQNLNLIFVVFCSL